MVLRRCGLVLLQIIAAYKIVALHWNDPVPNLRLWAKEHNFNRSGIRVAFTNLKNNKVVVHENAEDVLLFGQRVGPKFP